MFNLPSEVFIADSHQGESGRRWVNDQSSPYIESLWRRGPEFARRPRDQPSRSLRREYQPQTNRLWNERLVPELLRSRRADGLGFGQRSTNTCQSLRVRRRQPGSRSLRQQQSLPGDNPIRPFRSQALWGPLPPGAQAQTYRTAHLSRRCRPATRFRLREASTAWRPSADDPPTALRNARRPARAGGAEPHSNSQTTSTARRRKQALIFSHGLPSMSAKGPEPSCPDRVKPTFQKGGINRVVRDAIE